MKKKKTKSSIVEDGIIRDIDRGVYQEGALIPTEKELAKKYNVSPGTARKAALSLAQQGLLHRIPGKGTIVNFDNYNRIKYYRFVESIGAEFFSFNLSVLDIDIIPADKELSACLKLRAGSKIIKLERMGKISEDFLIHTISFLPKRFYRGLESYPRDQFIKNALWKIQEAHYKIKIKEKQEFLSIVSADAHISQLLEVAEQTPVLRIEMILVSQEDKVVEYRISHCNIGRYKFVTLQSTI